jgi:hypothetical protein
MLAMLYHRMAYQIIVGGRVSAESVLREKIPTTPWAEYARYALPQDGVPDYCWARSTGRKRSARETPYYEISNQCCEKIVVIVAVRLRLEKIDDLVFDVSLEDPSCGPHEDVEYL